MKNIKLCMACDYGRIIVKDDVIVGRSCELPMSVFLSRPHNKHESDDECSDFRQSHRINNVIKVE